MHEYDLDRRTHAFFDSVSLVSPRQEKPRIYAIYLHFRHYDFIKMRTNSIK